MTAQTLATIGLITSREFRERTRKKVFIVPTLLLAVLALLGMFAPTVIGLFAQNEAQTKVVVLNGAGPVAGQDTVALVASLDRTLNTSSPAPAAAAPASTNKPAFVVAAAETTDAAALAQQVKDGGIDAALIIARR